MIDRDIVGTTELRLIAVTNGKANVILARKKGDDPWDMFRASLWKDRIVVPSIARGQLSVTIHDVHGRELARKELRLPGIRLKDEVGRVEMSDAGLAVTDISVMGRDDAQVYLFGKTGRVMRCLGNGASPVITADGRQIAFKKSYLKDSDRYVVAVHDVPKNKTIYLQAWRPIRFRDVYPLLGGLYAAYVSELRWSRDGKWLLCGLRREFSVSGLILTAIDTESQQPKRCYLPMIVEYGQWIAVEP